MKILSILLLCIVLLQADKHHKDKHSYSKDLTYLQLNPTQTDLIKHIIKKYRKEIKAFREYKENREEQKKTIFLEDKFNPEKIISIEDEIERNRVQIEIDFLKQIHSILDKLQREKFANYIDEWEIE